MRRDKGTSLVGKLLEFVGEGAWVDLTNLEDAEI
jgi:hypothetical protein